MTVARIDLSTHRSTARAGDLARFEEWKGKFTRR